MFNPNYFDKPNSLYKSAAIKRCSIFAVISPLKHVLEQKECLTNQIYAKSGLVKAIEPVHQTCVNIYKVTLFFDTSSCLNKKSLANHNF